MKRAFLLAGILGAVAAWAAETTIDYTNRKIKGNLTVDGTTTLTGATTQTGTLGVATVTATTGISSPTVDAGTLFVRGNEQHAGTFQGSTTVDVLDAGVVRINGDFQIFGNPVCSTDAVCGSIALSSGTPSTATKTVRTGASCACWPVGNSAAIAAGGCAASVSSTTLTLTGPNTVTTTVRYHCWY